MSTTRLSLIKEGEIVLLLNYGKEEAFHVLEQNADNNGLTKGMTISNGDIVYFGGGKATLPMTDGWIKKERKRIEGEIEEKKVLLQKLNEIDYERSI